MDPDPFDWNAFFEELSGGSERACAVVGAAILDASLEELLRSYLVGDLAELNNLLKSDHDFAPLRDFGSRITCAYLLGAIDANVMHDLRKIKDARNLFSHSERGLSFGDNAIKKIILKLKTPDMMTSAAVKATGIPQPSPAPRARFVWTVVMLIGYLRERSRTLGAVRLKPAPEFRVTVEMTKRRDG